MYEHRSDHPGRGDAPDEGPAPARRPPPPPAPAPPAPASAPDPRSASGGPGAPGGHQPVAGPALHDAPHAGGGQERAQLAGGVAAPDRGHPVGDRMTVEPE